MSSNSQAESRLGTADVPGQLSRTFFGGGVQGSRPSYSDSYQPPYTGYGVPQAPILSGGGFFPGINLYRGSS